jgi:hypothetical protein
MAKRRNPKSYSRKKSKFDLARSDQSTDSARGSVQGTPEIPKSGERHLAKVESSDLRCSDIEGMSQLLDKLHPQIIGNVAYVELCQALGVGEDLIDAAIPASLAFSEQMNPVDPLERLAMAQALIAHARAAWLATLATSQKDPKSLCMINEASGRASHTFARLMNAIQQYRKPARTTTTVSIGQANLASQQVVQNVLKQEGHKYGDQTSIGHSGPAPRTTALPPNEERPALSAINHQEDAAMDEVHWTKNGPGEGSRKPQRAKARRAVGRKNRIQNADEGDH